MSRSNTELDFIPMEKHSSQKSTAQIKLLQRRRSFRDIAVISRLNPELLKTVIESGSVNQSFIAKSSVSVPPSPKDDPTTFRPNSCSEGAPLTIFYNGTMAVFDLPSNKAENILKIAEKVVPKAVESPDSKVGASSRDERQILEKLNSGDLPMARRKSLHGFLQKRKERLILASPYGSSTKQE